MLDDFAAQLEAARAGDEAAFVGLFRRTQPALLRYLRTLAPSLAEDVAAETWVSVVRGIHRFRGDESGWRAWVFTIAQARLRDAQRKALRTPASQDLGPELDSLADHCDVAEDVEANLGAEAALALVGRLPTDQASAVLLRYVVGLDAAQTAKVLGKRAGTVRVNAHRGLRRLAEILERERPGVTLPDVRAMKDM